MCCNMASFRYCNNDHQHSQSFSINFRYPCRKRRILKTCVWNSAIELLRLSTSTPAVEKSPSRCGVDAASTSGWGIKSNFWILFPLKYLKFHQNIGKTMYCKEQLSRSAHARPTAAKSKPSKASRGILGQAVKLCQVLSSGSLTRKTFWEPHWRAHLES